MINRVEIQKVIEQDNNPRPEPEIVGYMQNEKGQTCDLRDYDLFKHMILDEPIPWK